MDVLDKMIDIIIVFTILCNKPPRRVTTHTRLNSPRTCAESVGVDEALTVSQTNNRLFWYNCKLHNQIVVQHRRSDLYLD